MEINKSKSLEHLNDNIWVKVNTLLIKKCICEFSHEQLIQPQLLEEGDWNKYVLKTDIEEIVYSFEAKPMELNYMYVNTSSIRKVENNKPVRLDAISFIQELKGSLNIPEEIYPSYLEEIISTLYSNAYKQAKSSPDVK